MQAPHRHVPRPPRQEVAGTPSFTPADVKKLFKELGDVVDDPPRLPTDAALKLAPLHMAIPRCMMYMHELKVAGNTRGEVRFAKAMADCRDAIMENLLENIDSLGALVRVETDHPWSVLMGFVVCMSQLTFIIERASRNTLTSIAYHSAEVQQPANAFPFTVQTHCICSTQPLHEYRVSDIDATIDLLNDTWHLQTPSQEMVAYLQGLLHRVQILIATPGTHATHDVDKFCHIGEKTTKTFDSTDDDTVLVYMDRPEAVAQSKDVTSPRLLNSHGIRIFAGALLRMIFMVRFVLSLEVEPTRVDEPEMRAQIAALRTRMLESMKQLEVMSGTRDDLGTHQIDTSVSLGDKERFQACRGLERPEYRKVQRRVKVPEALQASTRLVRKADLREIITDMHEEAADYGSRYTATETQLAHNAKIIVASMSFSGTAVSFREDYTVLESKIPEMHGDLLVKTEPVLMSIMNRFHVLHRGRLLWCVCIEEAICRWIEVVMTELDGMLGEEDIEPQLNHLLNKHVVYAEDDHWKNGLYLDVFEDAARVEDDNGDDDADE